MFCAWLSAFRISWIAFASRWPEEKPANICAALFGESLVTTFTSTSISPHVGSTRNIVLGLPQKRPVGVFFAIMAAPETCASLTAPANPATGAPFPSVVPKLKAELSGLFTETDFRSLLCLFIAAMEDAFGIGFFVV